MENPKAELTKLWIKSTYREQYDLDTVIVAIGYTVWYFALSGMRLLNRCLLLVLLNLCCWSSLKVE